LIELTSEHKVIFAGNPVSYGGRQLPAFLKKHGNAVMFDPMPAAYIYQEILKPLLTGYDDNTAQALVKPILEVNDYLTSISQNDVLITPRELTTMVLFTLAYLKANKQADPEQVARYYAWNLAKHHVPEAHRSEFDTQFKTAAPRERVLPDLNKINFLPTESNRSAREALQDFIDLRKQRMQSKTAHEIQQYGGLGGLVLEGEPGIGKSEMVMHTLEKNHVDFYHIPMSMPLTKKKQTLLKAFHEGAVVVIDEINSGSMLESLMNDLLMGLTPEGKRPKNPGFLLIGTQNPSSMAGRTKASSALQHRLQTIPIPNYDTPEMIDILKIKGLEERTAQNMVHEYLTKRQQAEQDPNRYKLCFRDVLKRAKIEIYGTKRRVHPSLADIQAGYKQIMEKRRVNEENEVASNKTAFRSRLDM
jgi:MoxR-like ATPase